MGAAPAFRPLPMASADLQDPPGPVEITLPGLDQPFVTGSVESTVGKIPPISSSLNFQDHWGTFKTRWGAGRMNYKVEPGLYALGRPDAQSPVLVTANYKLSFDSLRSALPGRDVWILVLDTKGVNVWCAAGKGTFGTAELVRRIESSGLDQVVEHRQLILPQLSAPGIAAHLVKRLAGFEVRYGPIRAKDLPEFLDSKGRASPAMRRKTFTLWERIVLIPVELVDALKTGVFVALALFLLGGLGGPAGFWSNALSYGLFAVIALAAAIFVGAVLTPILLPWLPGRAFSVKGLHPGLVMALVLLLIKGPNLAVWPGRFEFLAWLLLIPAASAYLAMNFTGASTFTSLSGVKKEMRLALPCQIAAGAVGLGLWLWSGFLA